LNIDSACNSQKFYPELLTIKVYQENQISKTYKLFISNLLGNNISHFFIEDLRLPWGKKFPGTKYKYRKAFIKHK
jgi:hypothetical protein